MNYESCSLPFSSFLLTLLCIAKRKKVNKQCKPFHCILHCKPQKAPSISLQIGNWTMTGAYIERHLTVSRCVVVVSSCLIDATTVHTHVHSQIPSVSRAWPSWPPVSSQKSELHAADQKDEAAVAVVNRKRKQTWHTEKGRLDSCCCCCFSHHPMCSSFARC